MKLKQNFLIIFFAFILVLIGCGKAETQGARLTFKLEEIPFFVSKPINHVELTYGDRMLIHLNKEDSKSLSKLLGESEQFTVNVYFGESYYDTVQVLGGKDYSTINLPYLDNADDILSAEGVEIKRNR
jgi:hypothetical protein